MGTETWLWMALVTLAAVYYWIARNIVLKPGWALPRILRNRTARSIAGIAPLAGFFGIIALAFLYTNRGWWFLAASAAVFFLLAFRPHSELRSDDQAMRNFEDLVQSSVIDTQRMINEANSNAILHAIRTGNLDYFRYFIRTNRKSLNDPHQPHGWTLLHTLASLGSEALPVHTRMADELLEAGAEVNCRTVLGWTPIHIIAMQGQRETCDLARVLIAHGADLAVTDNHGLDWRMHWQHGLEIRKVLEGGE